MMKNDKDKATLNTFKKCYCIAVFTILLMPCLAQAQDVLCPEPSNTATTAPADLAQVQSDIDRLSLCVERAKLLSELDNTIKDRDGDSKSVLSAVKPLNPSANEVSKVIEQQGITVKNLPPVSPLSESYDIDNEQADNEDNTWKIRRIWGGKGTTKAQLAKGNGTVATIVLNDVLPDGYVVVNLSSIGVSIKKDGHEKELDWAVIEDKE